SDVNFSVDSFDVATHEADHAPADGMFNYSLDFGGPAIQSIAVQTTPSTGPKVGRQFAVAPVGLTLPPSGAIATSQRGRATQPLFRQALLADGREELLAAEHPLELCLALLVAEQLDPRVRRAAGNL